MSYLKVGVIDIEALTDHAIIATVYRPAKKHGLKHLLVGSNVATEGILPWVWVHLKTGLKNIRAIQQAYGTMPLRSYPTASFLKIRYYYQGLLGISEEDPLNYIDYNETQAMAVLERELGWRYYGGKHYESIFTRLYQGYILPRKFIIDKRRAHLSSLIMTGELTRDQALAELKNDPYPEALACQDREFVLKKLGFSDAECDEIMRKSPRPHEDFASDLDTIHFLQKIKRCIWKQRSAT